MSEALLIGFASLFIWYLLAEASIFDKPLGWVREHAAPLIGCPWCCGFWITGVICLATGYNLLVHLAAAGITGWVGSKSG